MNEQCFSFPRCPVIYFFFPETCQRSLEDINDQFGDKVAVHYYDANEAKREEYAQVVGSARSGDVVSSLWEEK